MRLATAPLIALLAATSAGCSGDGLHSISGSVTLEGQMLENGTIEFLPADGRGPTAGAIIERGRYSVRMAPGPKTVRIHGFKKVGQGPAAPGDPTSPMIDVNQQIVPAKYNTHSGLHCEVTSDKLAYDFALTGN